MADNSNSELKLHFLDYWRVIRVRFGLILLAFLLVVITAGVITYFQPRLFPSTVKMEVQPAMADMEIFGRTASPGAPRIDPRFAQLQFEILQTKSVLYPVIERLNLTQRWAVEGTPISQQGAFSRLRRMMQLRENRNTNLLEITIFNTDPAEAAEIANTIAEVYQDTKIEEQQATLDRALRQLDTELAKQREEVAQAAARMRDLREKYCIIDLNPESIGEVSDPIRDLIRSKEAEVNSARTNAAALRTQYERITHLEGDELMRALSTLQIPDPIISKNLPLYQDARSEEARLFQAGLGENHPRVQSLRAQMRVYQEHLEDQIASIRNALRIRLEISESTVETMEQQLAAYYEQEGDVRRTNVEYEEAKRDYIHKRSIYDAAHGRYMTQLLERGMPATPVIIREKAEASPAPARPRVRLNMVIGVVVGLIIGIGLAFFIEYLDTSVKTLEDVEHFLGLPVLAVVPQGVNLLHKEPAGNPDAEAYRILRTNIEFNRRNAESNSLTFVSGGPGEGKTTTLANTAFAFAEGGYSVLMVDADLRRPALHKVFEVDNKIGLTNYLTTDIALDEVIQPTVIDNLYLMPSGLLPSDAVGVLNSQHMIDMIEEIKSRFDIVLLDSPPILGVSDASVLASEVDLTIIVVQHRRFPRTMLQRVKKAVVDVGGNLLGVILNNVDVKHDQNYQYYTSYYDYYTTKPKTKKSGAFGRSTAKTQSAAEGEDPY